MVRQITIDLTPEESRLLSKDGKTAAEVLKERTQELSRKEIQDWWDSLSPAGKRAVYDAHNP